MGGRKTRVCRPDAPSVRLVAESRAATDQPNDRSCHPQAEREVSNGYRLAKLCLQLFDWMLSVMLLQPVGRIWSAQHRQ
ncbi:MAG TPA: hypothetical protein PKD54_07990 [Pirellulaceae bacterium]|nr:hypothetical protein [Pirellulaceae bacterium]